MSRKDAAMDAEDSVGARKRLLLHFGISVSGSRFWESVPFTTKDNLKSLRAPAEFAAMRTTNGSTGAPLSVFYSKGAVLAMVARNIHAIRAMGIGKDDFLLSSNADEGLWARSCAEMGIRSLSVGIPVYDSGMDDVVDAVLRTRPTVWAFLPSKAIRLLELVDSVAPDYKPRIFVCQGEPFLNTYTEKLGGMGIELYNNFGLTECRKIGLSRRGDPKAIRVSPPGLWIETAATEKGTELVLTDLENLATPIIRYRSGDIVEDVKYNDDGSVREFTPVGRKDHMIKLRGALVSGQEIVEKLSKYTDDFVVSIKTANFTDVLEVLLPECCKPCRKEISSDLSYLFVGKRLVFVKEVDVPKTKSGKSKHIIDMRA
ncbi:AMP-binding enzyme [uncultured archaeon]|nr:AMP-binding enzyme [uncultured archaeon]